jgi:hypothetical protein
MDAIVHLHPCATTTVRNKRKLSDHKTQFPEEGHHWATLAAGVKASRNTNASDYFLLTAFFSFIPAENFGTFLAEILMAAPV